MKNITVGKLRFCHLRPPARKISGLKCAISVMIFQELGLELGTLRENLCIVFRNTIRIKQHNCEKMSKS